MLCGSTWCSNTRSGLAPTVTAAATCPATRTRRVDDLASRATLGRQRQRDGRRHGPRRHAQRYDHHDGERQQREAEEDVDHALDRKVKPAAPVRADHAPCSADDCPHSNATHRDREGRARAVKHPAEHVAAKVVRAQQVGRAGPLQPARRVRLQRTARRHDAREERRRHGQRDNGTAETAAAGPDRSTSIMSPPSHARRRTRAGPATRRPRRSQG